MALTEAQIQALWSANIHPLETTREDVAANILSQIDTAQDTVPKGDFSNQQQAALAVFRAAMAGAQSNALAASIIRPNLREYGQLIQTPVTNDLDLIAEIYDRFIDLTLRVQSRGFTSATPVADGGNTGDLVIQRLTVDAQGFALEMGYPDAKSAECIRDRRNGAVINEEQFRLKGAEPDFDVLERLGSGASTTLTAISARSSRQWVTNPSWDVVTIGIDPAVTAISGWVPTGSFTNFETDVTNTFATFQGAVLDRSIKFLTNDTLTQDLEARRSRFDSRLPYYLQISVVRLNSADGTLTLTWGGVSVSVDLTTLTNGVFAPLRIAIGVDNWYGNVNQNDLEISIAWTGRTTGQVSVDDLRLAPWTFFDGGWYAGVGALIQPIARADKVPGDLYEWTDTITGVEGVIQRWLWRAFRAAGIRQGLPHDTVASGNITFADP